MNKTLDEWRKEIDTIDDEFLHILAKRIDVIREIGKLKKAENIEPRDETRWLQLLHDKLIKGKNLKLSEEFVEKIYILIHEYSLKTERDQT